MNRDPERFDLYIEILLGFVVAFSGPLSVLCVRLLRSL